MLADADQGRPAPDWIATTGLAHRLPRPLATLLGMLPQLSRYTLVSALALGLDFLVYLSLAGAGMRATLAGVIGYSAGMVLHYALSRRFVFDTAGSAKSERRRFMEFVVSGLVGIVLTAAIIAAATDILQLGVLVAKIIAVGVSFLTVFALRKSVVFASGA